MSRSAREWGPVDQLIAIDGALERYGLAAYRDYVSSLRDELFRPTNTSYDFQVVRGKIDALDQYFVDHGFPSPSDSVRTDAPMGSAAMNALAKGESVEAARSAVEGATDAIGDAAKSLAIGGGIIVAIAIGIGLYFLLDSKGE